MYSTGGIFGWKPEECSQETPDVQSSLFKYADGKILEFETRGRASNREGSLNTRVGNIFYGTKGFMELDKSDWKAYYENETEPFAGSAIHGPARQSDPTFLTPNKSSDHSANLINAIRSGDPGKLFCDTKEGHFSSALPHLANISYRLGRPLTFMGDYEKFANDDAANLMLTRKYRKPYVITKEV